MAYIVGLTVIMQMIFLKSASSENGLVSTAEVEEVLRRYKSEKQDTIHGAVRQFVQGMNPIKAIAGRDQVFDKVVELIEQSSVQANRPET